MADPNMPWQDNPDDLYRLVLDIPARTLDQATREALWERVIQLVHDEVGPDHAADVTGSMHYIPGGAPR